LIPNGKNKASKQKNNEKQTKFVLVSRISNNNYQNFLLCGENGEYHGEQHPHPEKNKHNLCKI
jgi:hypothetical protein